MYQTVAQAKAMEKKYIEMLLKQNPDLIKKSGIYFLTREDENGFKYAYIGQAKNVLQRLASHCMGYQQHIDLSLKKHKLYDKEKNPYGWRANSMYYGLEDLDDREQYWIKRYAEEGYQLRNVSLGGQGKGRNMINETKPSKGYRDGIKAGELKLVRELRHIIDMHLIITPKKETKAAQNGLDKFWKLLNEDNYR